MNQPIVFSLFGGQYDGVAAGFPWNPASLWAGPCPCGCGGACGTCIVAVKSDAPSAVASELRDKGFLEYQRDRLMPTGKWRYVCARERAVSTS